MNRLVRGLVVTFLLLAFVGTAFAALEGTSKWDREIQPAKAQVTNGTPELSKGTTDIMRYPIPATGLVNFVGWPYDVFYQYYVPDADGEIQEIFFRLSDVTGVENGNNSFAVTIWGTSYLTWDMGDQAGRDDVGIGYYEDEEGDYSWQGTNWVDLNPEWTPGDPLTERIWPTYLEGQSVEISSDLAADDTVSLELTAEGAYPTMEAGVPFAVIAEFQGVDARDPEGRLGFMSGDIQPYEYLPAMKFYDEFSNSEISKFGWFIRSYIWDWSVQVYLTGDRPPIIEHTPLITTVSTDDRLVVANITDDNPSGGSEGVASAAVVYTVNGGAEQTVTMTKGSGDEYTAPIPGQSAGSVVEYKVTATDVEGNVGETPTHEYMIFLPESPVLVLNNSGYSMAWFGAYVWAVALDYDVWSYGEAEVDLLNNYDYIVDLGGHGTDTYDALKTWADVGGKNYLGFGDELLGYPYGWPASPMAMDDGTFFKDVMGIKTYIADINASDNDAPSIVEPVEGDVVTGPLYDELNAEDPVPVLYYWPAAIAGNLNWFDGFEKVDGAVESMIGYAEDNTTAYTAGILNETANGTKSAFYGVDPLCLNAISDSVDWWYPNYLPAMVFSNFFTQEEVIVRFQVDMGVEIVKEAFDPATDVVDVRGSFNDWAHNDNDVLAKDPSDDDLYLLDRTFNDVGAGQTEEYKFVHNGGGSDNWESADNRVLTFDGSESILLPRVFFSNISWDDITNQEITVIFKVDVYPLKKALDEGMDIVDVQTESDTISSYDEVAFIGVNGFFNGWPWADVPDENKLFDDGQGEDVTGSDGIFSGSVVYPAYSAKEVIYKYGANGFDNEAGFDQNHSAVVDDSETVFELDMDCFGMQNEDPLLPWGQGVDTLDTYDCDWWVKVDDDVAGVPDVFELRQNYPNPFNPSTTIEFSIPERAEVTMTIYNVLGQAVRTFNAGSQNVGTYRIVWDGTNDFGMTVSTGVYFYTVRAGEHTATKKMVYMK
jgi:hypothetical protein